MADKTVIVEIQYDTTQAIKNLESLTSTIEGEKVAQAQLKHELEVGAISQKEYAMEVEKSKDTTSKANTERKNTISLLSAEKGSNDQLKATIKQLTVERDALDKTTVEGATKYAEYNLKIDANKKALAGVSEETKKAGGAFASLKENLGNIGGPIGSFIDGMFGMVKASLAFIATPIGAIIGALGLALMALTAYFKGSEEGQNRLNAIMNIGKAVIEALMNVVEDVGEVIYDAVTKPKEMIEKLGELIKENLINRFTAFGVIGKAIVKILSGDFKQGFKDLAEGGIQAATGVSNSFDKFGKLVDAVKEKIKSVTSDIEKNIEMANKLSAIQADIDKRERDMLVSRAKKDNEVSELRLKATEKDTYSQKERLVFLQQAANIIDGFTASEKKLAKEKYDAAILNQKISGDDKDALKAVAEAEANSINVRKNALDERRGIQKQISTLILNEQKETEDALNNEFEAKKLAVQKNLDTLKASKFEEREEINKTVTASIDAYHSDIEASSASAENKAKLFADEDKLRNDQVISNQKAAEEQKKIEDDLTARRGEAIMKIANAKAEQMALDAKTEEEKKALAIEEEEANFTHAIEQKGLLDIEIEALEEQHKLRLADIDAQYQAKIKAQQQKNLDEARAAMQQIIAATQGMADKRVTIASDAFAKLATINFAEVKNAGDAFAQIGTAASGLTSMITAGHDKELSSMNKQKAAELALAGDNTEKQDAINKKYAKIEGDIKKKQFNEDKKKAIIDIALATLIATAKAIAASPITLGLPWSAIIPAMGAAQIVAVASKQFEPEATYAKGGIIGGKSHANGGTRFIGSDGSRFEAERGEAMFILKKDATAEIAAYSQINESYGGRSWMSGGSNHLAEGGEVSPVDIDKSVNDAMQRTPIYVRVDDISLGLTNMNNVKQAGVI